MPCAAAVALAAVPAQARQTRYSPAGGCYRVDGLPGAERVRMQATGLGRYLLYRPDGTFVAARPGGAATPSSGSWTAT